MLSSISHMRLNPVTEILKVPFTCHVYLPKKFSMCMCMLVAQSCPSLCNSTDCSPPGFSVHGILQARIMGWIAIPFSRGSSWPRGQTLVSCIAGRFFTIWATGKSFSMYMDDTYWEYMPKNTKTSEFFFDNYIKGNSWGLERQKYSLEKEKKISKN